MRDQGLIFFEFFFKNRKISENLDFVLKNIDIKLENC